MPGQLPDALKPRYHTSVPNRMIQLFAGNLELFFAQGQRISAPGTVEWRWLPHPSIRFALSSIDQYPDFSQPPEARLDIPTLNLSCEVVVTNVEVREGSAYYDGLVPRSVLVGMDTDCDQVIFHLPNFLQFIGEVIRAKDSGTWAGRLRLESDSWVICLDEDRTVRQLTKGLKYQGGYAITHVGQLRRCDSGHFTFSEADDTLQAVYYFLSFVRGLWCGPVLAFGRMGGADMWQEWTVSRLTPWKYVESWFPLIGAQDNIPELNQAFRGFMAKWDDSLWRDPIKHSIHWYVEANIGAGGVEGGIVLTQTALELLGWLYFVEDPPTATLTAAQFDRMNAETKIRDLLRALNIPVGIPTCLQNLRCEVGALQASDGPSAFVRLRNAIVHPKKSKRSVILQTSVHARNEAKDLGLWYVEMVLLRIFGYEGEYYQRFLGGWPDQVRAKVPWA